MFSLLFYSLSSFVGGTHTHSSIAEPLFKLPHSSIISLTKSNLIEMYAETGLMFPYFQNFSLQAQNLDDFCRSNPPNSSMGSLVQTSTILEYDLGGEGDLFKAPEPIIEQPLVDINPMTASISMISCGQDAISSQPLKAVDIELIENEQFLSEVFYYDCKKDMLVKNGTETPFSEIMDIKIPVVATDQNLLKEEKMLSQGSFPKSVSYECLRSMDWVNGPQVGPDFLNLPGIDFSADYGMRRAFSEGDIKTLANGNVSLVQSPLGQQQPIFSNCTSEERMEKLSRYRNKKTKRNFGRKIKYACRKALADSQPRIRGRFAKTEETDILRKQ